MPKSSYYFQGFRSPNYTMVPDELFDELLGVLSGAELKAALYIIRRTFGFKRESDSISLSQMLHGVHTRDGRVLDHGAGLSKPTLLQALRSLEKMHIIQRERRRSLEKGDETTVYSLTMAEPAPGQKVIPPLVKKFDQGGGQGSLPGPWSRNLTTQETDVRGTEEQQHSVGVVGELTERGMTKAVAEHLTSKHRPEYLEAKIDLVDWLLEHDRKAVGKNAAGFLRRAIEDDYQPPAAYKTPDQRQAEAEQQRLRDEQRARQLELEQERERQQNAEERKVRERARRAFQQEHPPQQIPGTALTTETAWRQTLKHLKEQMTAANYQTWLAETALVSCDESEAVVVGPSSYVVDWLVNRFKILIERQLKDVLGYHVDTRYLAATELEKPDKASAQNGQQNQSQAPPSN